MKGMSELRHIQDLFVRFRKLRTKILDDLAISFVCLVNRNESLLKKIVYLDLRAHKKDISRFFVYYLVLNYI